MAIASGWLRIGGCVGCRIRVRLASGLEGWLEDVSLGWFQLRDGSRFGCCGLL